MRTFHGARIRLAMLTMVLTISLTLSATSRLSSTTRLSLAGPARFSLQQHEATLTGPHLACKAATTTTRTAYVTSASIMWGSLVAPAAGQSAHSTSGMPAGSRIPVVILPGVATQG